MSRGKRITKEERERMVELRNSGMSAEQIAEEMGRCTAAIRNTLKKVDFTPKMEKNELIPVIENPQGNIIDNFTPLYKRIKYLNEQKKKIDDELRNIRATLQNAVDIIDSGDTAQQVKPSWGVLNDDCCNHNRRNTGDSGRAWILYVRSAHPRRNRMRGIYFRCLHPGSEKPHVRGLQTPADAVD